MTVSKIRDLFQTSIKVRAEIVTCGFLGLASYVGLYT